LPSGEKEAQQMKSAHGYQRKDVFSNPRTQMKVVGVFAALALLFTATTYQVVHRLLAALSGPMLRLPLSEQNRTDLMLILEQQQQMLDIQLAILTFLTIFVLLTGGVLLSHRIGGPLYQMRKYMDGMTAGTVPQRRIRFRKGDFFHDLADSFNRFQQSRGILDEGPKEPGAPRDSAS
jgi:nitrogen fixation/metabolism regulation signal transduction histidine kinase